MKLIRFPKAVQSYMRQNGYKIDKLDNPTDYLVTGSFDYTCPSCGNKATFTPTGMIFKYIEFYCSKCGIKNRVTNPAFQNRPKE